MITIPCATQRIDAVSVVHTLHQLVGEVGQVGHLRHEVHHVALKLPVDHSQERVRLGISVGVVHNRHTNVSRAGVCWYLDNSDAEVAGVLTMSRWQQYEQLQAEQEISHRSLSSITLCIGNECGDVVTWAGVTGD